VAPIIHQDTKEFYDFSIVKHKSKEQSINIKPYSIPEFIDVTLKTDNFNDMENYTNQIINDFKNNY
ncbi:MAG: AlwI family type II restriction endonuclease, partial [Bacteroidales bacterium]|nr:AlwI family type II restriction endonuclease [Bacteroidales bacterium]